MQVRVLGQVEVVDAGAGGVPLNGPTQRRLVAALALRRNEVVPFPRRAPDLWC